MRSSILKKNLLRELEIIISYINCRLPEDLLKALRNALSTESSNIGRNILRQILENAYLATRESLPLCQDTGMINFFLKINPRFSLDFDIIETLQEVSSKSYQISKCRKSITPEPLMREKYQHTPAIFHIEHHNLPNIEIDILIKGGGSENASRFLSIPPGTTKEEIKKVIVKTALEMIPLACPPVIIGIGIGGNFETSAILAKKALLREIGLQHPQEHYRNLEEEILKEINLSGIGPQALGGDVTALAVHIEKFATHISTLPVAIQVQCHSLRRAKLVLPYS